MEIVEDLDPNTDISEENTLELVAAAPRLIDDFFLDASGEGFGSTFKSAEVKGIRYRVGV
eukprot:3661776-Ditylum_brightwellii.AAC.1